MALQVLFGAIYVISFGVSLWSLTRLNAFLAQTAAISDEAALRRFKELARVQMYLALAMIVLLGAGILVGIVLVSRHGMGGFVAVILTNLAVFGLGVYHKRVEVRTRSLPAAEALAAEYQRVSETWLKKPLPDF